MVYIPPLAVPAELPFVLGGPAAGYLPAPPNPSESEPEPRVQRYYSSHHDQSNYSSLHLARLGLFFCCGNQTTLLFNRLSQQDDDGDQGSVADHCSDGGPNSSPDAWKRCAFD